MRHMLVRRRHFAVLLTVALIGGVMALAVPAGAATVVYTDSGPFVADTGATAVAWPAQAETALPNHPFGSIDTNLDGHGCVAVAGQPISLAGGSVQVYNANSAALICFFDSGWQEAPLSNTDPKPLVPTIVGNGEDDYRVQISFAVPQHAVGFGLLTNKDASETVTLTFSDLTTEVIADSSLGTGPNTFEFIGFRSEKPIIKVELNTTGGASQNEGITGIWTSPYYLPPTTSCDTEAGEFFVSGDATGPNPPSDTPIVLFQGVTPGCSYDVTASGTYFAGGTYTWDIQADAEYSQDAYQRAHGIGWTDSVNGYGGAGEGLLELKIDGQFVEWGDYTPTHVYTLPWLATVAPMSFQFQIYDSYPWNNTGGLCVAVEQTTFWSLSGFYRPVDMDDVWNVVKGGSTVPLKFEAFDCSGVEFTEVADLGAEWSLNKVSCPAEIALDPIETIVDTGGTSLRYDPEAGQFIRNWTTPTVKGCYQLTLTLDDGASITANFKIR